MLKDKIKINDINVNGLKETISNIKKNPNLGKCEFRTKNTWISGDENQFEINTFYGAGGEQKHKQSFKFRAGEPDILEGKDNGANPVEYLLGALSGCMTTTIAYYAALNGFKIDKMTSQLNGKLDLQGLLGLDKKIRPGFQQIDVTFDIKTDAPKEEIEKYYPHSPVFDVISKSLPINVKLNIHK